MNNIYVQDKELHDELKFRQFWSCNVDSQLI